MKKFTLILMALAVISLLSFSAVTVSVEKPAQPPAQTVLSIVDMAGKIGGCETGQNKVCGDFINCPGNCGKYCGNACIFEAGQYCTKMNRTCCIGYPKLWCCGVI